jgi:hypothetical protein
MSDIFYTPPASGGGGQNPTTNFIPLNNGTSSFVDSNIANIQNSRFYGFFTGFEYGLDIDYTNNVSKLGDFNYHFQGNALEIYSFNTWTKYQNNLVGIWLDFNNKLYRFGDFSNLSNGTSFWIDDQNGLIRTYSSGQRNGLQFDFGTKTYSLGDFDSINSGTAIFIEDANENITLRANQLITFQGNNLQDNNPRTYTNRNIVVIAPSGGTYYLPLYQ